LERVFDAWWSLESIQNIMSHEMGAADCIRRKSGGGLCTSLPFFFLETEQEGEGNSRRWGSQAMGAGPLAHGNTRGGEKMERRLRGFDSGPHLVRRQSTEGYPR
jgi:hypothetical protein